MLFEGEYLNGKKWNGKGIGGYEWKSPIYEDLSDKEEENSYSDSNFEE